MVLRLDYGSLNNLVSGAKNMVSNLEGYCNDLCSRVQKKLGEVDGGGSENLENASYYVKQKIQQINQRKSNAEAIASAAQNLLDVAKRVDGQVKSMIEANQESFFTKYPDLRPSQDKLGLAAFLTDLENVPVIGWIIRGSVEMSKALDEFGKGIRHWWKCGGGQEIVMNALDVVVKIGLAVAAVVTAVAAVAAVAAGGIFAAVVAAAACIAAAIAVVNAIANTVTSVQAIAAGKDDPAMAKIYGKRDSLSSVLRETNFRDWDPVFTLPGGETYKLNIHHMINRKSTAGAAFLDFADAAASLILVVDGAGKAINTLFKNNGISFAFKELVRDSSGKLTSKMTPESIWKGTKALVLNEKLTSSTSKGLRTTLFTNLWEKARYQGVLFRNAVRDPMGWWNMRQAGSTGSFVQDTLNKIRYNFTLFKNADTKTKIVESVAMAKRAADLTKLTIDGIARTDGQGIALRYLGEWSRTKIFAKSDVVKVISKTGIGGLFFGDRLKWCTGIAKDGILQKSKAVIDKGLPLFGSKPWQASWNYCLTMGDVKLYRIEK